MTVEKHLGKFNENQGFLKFNDNWETFKKKFGGNGDILIPL